MVPLTVSSCLWLTIQVRILSLKDENNCAVEDSTSQKCCSSATEDTTSERHFRKVKLTVQLWIPSLKGKGYSADEDISLKGETNKQCSCILHLLKVKLTVQLRIPSPKGETNSAPEDSISSRCLSTGKKQQACCRSVKPPSLLLTRWPARTCGVS